MAEFWAEIQPHLWEIVGNLGMIAAIIWKAPTKTKEEILKRKKEKAHANSTKKEKALHKAYKKEAALEEKLKNEK